MSKLMTRSIEQVGSDDTCWILKEAMDYWLKRAEELIKDPKQTWDGTGSVGLQAIVRSAPALGGPYPDEYFNVTEAMDLTDDPLDVFHMALTFWEQRK